MIGASAAYLVL